MNNSASFSRQDPDSADNPISHLLPGSEIPPFRYSANESPPSGTRPVKKHGFIRTWLATSTDLRPTGDPTSIEWGIHWYTPVSMLLLLFMGVAAAITHHLFYSFLHNTTVGGEFQQRWTLWIGSALGFLTKVTLTAALGISRTQWVWLMLRKKWFTLDMIDSLFGIVSDPTLFFTWKTIRQAKVATVMAIAMWMFPLAAILTPGTISVRTVAREETVPCSVPSLLFGFDHSSTATTPAWGVDITVTDIWSWDDENESIRHQNRFNPALSLTAYTGTITRLPDLPPVDSPSLTTLGAKCGANCTYTVQFLGPTMTCAEFTAWNDTEWRNSSTYMESNLLRAVSNPAARGSFLVGIELRDTTNHPRVVFGCKSSTANYTVQHIIQDRRFQEPVITKFETVDLPTFEPYPVYPNTAYLPTFGLYRTIFRILDGTLIANGASNSESVNTLLMGDIYTNPSNVGKAIEQLAQRIIVSMIAFDLVYKGRKNVLNFNAIQETQCKTTENVVRYVYSPQSLLLVYGIAVACALTASVAGFIALRRNGMASTKTVSAIIRTTRNRTLDECIVGGDCLGGNVLSSGLDKVELRFGALRTGNAPFALGVRGEIYPIKRD